MLAVFVTLEVAVLATALFVLDWSLPFVLLVAVVIHVIALIALIAIAAAKGRRRAERGGVRSGQAGGALSPLPPRDA